MKERAQRIKEQHVKRFHRRREHFLIPILEILNIILDMPIGFLNVINFMLKNKTSDPGIKQ